MASSKKGGLGRGLDAIFMDNDTIESEGSVIKLKISEIEPNRTQPRKEFDEKALAELADSISQHGLIQPLLVRPILGGGYQIVAGERRWRASRMAGLSELPVVIKELSDQEVMELALIENLQRENLSVIEEAYGYKTLMDEYNFTQEDVAKSVGKSRSAIANTLRILNLPQSILEMLKTNDLTAGHARAILSLENDEDKENLAKNIMENKLSVREAEKLAKKINLQKKESKSSSPKVKRATFFDEVELSLKDYLGRKVKVSNGKDDHGILQIEFYSQEDLADIARKLGGEE